MDKKISIILSTYNEASVIEHTIGEIFKYLNNAENFLVANKYFFGIGASLASFLFFFSLVYLAKFFSNYLVKSNVWKIINFFIIIFMTVLSSYVFLDIIDLI